MSAELLSLFSTLSPRNQKKFLKEAKLLLKQNHDNRPRRLPSPYMLFSKDHRAEATAWCEQHSERTDSNKIPPGAVMKRLGALWKEAKQSGNDSKYIQMRKEIETGQVSSTSEDTTSKETTTVEKSAVVEENTTVVEKSSTKKKPATKKKPVTKKKPTTKKKPATKKKPVAKKEIVESTGPTMFDDGDESDYSTDSSDF